MTEEEKIRFAMWMSRAGLLASGAIKQSCIASAKITTEVLRSLDIPARPMTASVLAATKGWFDRIEKEGRFPRQSEGEQWWQESRAYSLGVMYDPEPTPGAFTAHMIVLAGVGHRWLVDPSADQLARPQYDLPITPLMVDLSDTGNPAFDQREFRLGRTQAISHWANDDGTAPFVIVHSCFPADRSFRKLNDFLLFKPRYGRMHESIVETIKEMDALGLTGDDLPPLPDLPRALDDPSLMAQEKSPEEIRRLRATAH